MNRSIARLTLDFRPATTALLLTTLGTVGWAQNPTWNETPTLLQDDPDCANLMTCLATLSGEKDLIAVDIDCDGDQDVLIARKKVNLLAGLSNLLLMNDNGNLVDVTTVYTSFLTDVPRVTRDVQVIDANADGWPDVVFASTGGDQPRIYRNLGETGGAWQGLVEVPLTDWLLFFSYPGGVPGVTSVMFPPPKFCGVAIGDVDGDGLDDMFFVDYDNTLGHRLLMNVTVPGSANIRFEDRTDDPNGAFALFSNTELAVLDIGLQTGLVSFTASVDMADFDGENGLDLVYWQNACCGGTDATQIVLNFDGTGRFGEFESPVVAQQYAGAVIDYNQDGRPDLFTVTDNCDEMFANTGLVGAATLEYPIDGGITVEKTVTRDPGGCTHVADLDRDGLPDVGVSDLDVSDLSGDCDDIAQLHPALFHVLLNRTPGPLADPKECELVVYGETLASGDCTDASLLNQQPWNRNSVYDFAFLDLNQDGFQDILFGRCDGLEMWVMESFPSAGNYCDTPEGSDAVMHWSGSFSVAAASFTVEVEGAPPNLDGQFFFGPIQIKTPFGDGVQCVGGTVNRLSVVTTDANGHAFEALDFGNAPADQIVAGSTWNFQYQYREGAFNFSDAISVTFGP